MEQQSFSLKFWHTVSEILLLFLFAFLFIAVGFLLKINIRLPIEKFIEITNERAPVLGLIITVCASLCIILFSIIHQSTAIISVKVFFIFVVAMAIITLEKNYLPELRLWLLSLCNLLIAALLYEMCKLRYQQIKETIKRKEEDIAQLN